MPLKSFRRPYGDRNSQQRMQQHPKQTVQFVTTPPKLVLFIIRVLRHTLSQTENPL